MSNRRTSDKIRGWTRLAARFGVLLTEPKVRADISEMLRERGDSMADTVSDKYDDAVHRLGAAREALRGRTYWPSRVMGFLVGVGAGAGIGILLAPTSGSETREAIRGKAVDVKNKVAESASTITGKFARSVTSTAATGTEG